MDIFNFLDRDDYKASRPHPLGRPPKLTSEMIEQIYDLLIQGKSIAQAAVLTGISESTIHRWLAHGKSSDAEPIYVELVEAVSQATESSKFELLQRLRIAGLKPENWRSVAWMLERRFPEEFGPRNKEVALPNKRDEGPDSQPNLVVVN